MKEVEGYRGIMPKGSSMIIRASKEEIGTTIALLDGKESFNTTRWEVIAISKNIKDIDVGDYILPRNANEVESSYPLNFVEKDYIGNVIKDVTTTIQRCMNGIAELNKAIVIEDESKELVKNSFRSKKEIVEAKQTLSDLLAETRIGIYTIANYMIVEFHNVQSVYKKGSDSELDKLFQLHAKGSPSINS